MPPLDTLCARQLSTMVLISAQSAVTRASYKQQQAKFAEPASSGGKLDSLSPACEVRL